ncbi:MAG: class I SAM-dependent methyltransferase [Solirubrobacterales bacterium]
MDADEVRAGIAAIEAEHGPWHSHNIHLGHGVWTRSDRELVENSRLRRYLQAVSDAAGDSLAGLRVLDLACEEGAFGIEMARQGAEVVAIEGRAGNVARARFAAEALGLDRYQVSQGDIRELSVETSGEFDVVFSVGILYHLDAPAVFEHVHELARMSRRLLFLSTHVSRFAERRREFGGRSYRGCVVEEHPAGSGKRDREGNLRASLDNEVSFWLTRPSLFNLLANAGFSSVLELQMPHMLRAHNPGNTVNLVAFRGERVEVPRSELVANDPPARWPERGREPVHTSQSLRHRLAQELRRLRSARS